MTPVTSLITRRSQSSLMMGVGAVFAGTACAALRGNTEYLPATLCLLFVLFAQLGANFYYQHYDDKYNLGSAIDSQISSQESLSTRFSMQKEASSGLLMVALMIGATLAAMAGWWVIVVGAFILVTGWLSCAGSMPLLRTPFGPICSFILFGPVAVVSTSLIQSMHEAEQPVNWFDITPALYMSIVIGLMCVNCTLMYAYSTYVKDLRNAKASFATKFGRKVTRICYLVNGLIYTGVTVFMCLSLDLDMMGLDMLPSTICFIIDIYVWYKMRVTPRYQAHTLINITNLNVLIMGVLSFIIFEFTGIPDDSHLTFFGI